MKRSGIFVLTMLLVVAILFSLPSAVTADDKKGEHWWR